MIYLNTNSEFTFSLDGVDCSVGGVSSRSIMIKSVVGKEVIQNYVIYFCKKKCKYI